jgi:hypothetical protein
VNCSLIQKDDFHFETTQSCELTRKDDDRTSPEVYLSARSEHILAGAPSEEK